MRCRILTDNYAACFKNSAICLKSTRYPVGQKYSVSYPPMVRVPKLDTSNDLCTVPNWRLVMWLCTVPTRYLLSQGTCMHVLYFLCLFQLRLQTAGWTLMFHIVTSRHDFSWTHPLFVCHFILGVWPVLLPFPFYLVPSVRVLGTVCPRVPALGMCLCVAFGPFCN